MFVIVKQKNNLSLTGKRAIDQAIYLLCRHPFFINLL